ncbi:ankyrin repeat-containing domain protein [Aspergillus pseudonomiae]|uniref:Ankyrin repeat-containing domain protein n=1 Tax=Aspergillus pseudonomiae TaxID=1506151 RepID=A0A5N6I3Y4_9EURO|nr:ankyrin repeat-containing domain protein [Aspergillus pseudonomiae]KAB8261316.1 ankyrin repeat-containing domain protein [Aspergillus pseudonomiae]KAE8410051.1 ankyrin repeat-containing domain protein [Aspergillus pseudonomiae]
MHNVANITRQSLDEFRMTDIMQAIERGHVDAAQSLLNGVSPNIQDRTGRTLLSRTISFNSKQDLRNRLNVDVLFDLLIARGADPDLGDHTGETPLHWAAKAGDHEIVCLLLQKGAQSDPADKWGRTPLSRAAERGHNLLVERLLVDGRADSNSRDRRGRTPLSWAAENSHLHIVETLVDHGADVEIRDNEGQIPLWWFLNNTDRGNDNRETETDLVDFQRWCSILGPRGSTEPVTKKRRTFLAWACERGDQRLVQELLRTTWTDPNSIDRHRKTPLIYALEWKHYEIADMLMSGIDPETTKKDCVSLHLLIREGRSRLLKLFLDRYTSNLKEEDMYSTIPLMRMALQQSDRPTVRLLLDYKASTQGLKSSDWFGPCSTLRAAEPLVGLNKANWDGYSSIPVMEMTIQERDRTAVATLLGKRARILELEDDDDDFAQYSSNIQQSIAVDIMTLKDGRQDVEWILEEAFDQKMRKMTKSADESHLILFRENQPWNTYCQMDNLPNELEFSLGNRSPCRTFSLSIVTRFQNMKAPQESPEDKNGEYYRLRTIEWSVLEAPPKTIHYFSNLPFGWTPQSDLEFIELFMQTWKDDWISFCRDERRNLGHLRSYQLAAAGKDDLLIDAIAGNMQKWTQMQWMLEDQLNQAREFVSQYQAFTESRQLSEHMGKIITTFEHDVSNQIDKMEQGIRDLLQVEFAWVSINEAHRSTSLAASMKRLSWITFIFLPLMFTSSLLGMNVDILKDDPSWWWFLVIGGSLTFLTVVSWVGARFTRVETWLEHILWPQPKRKQYSLDQHMRPFSRSLPP